MAPVTEEATKGAFLVLLLWWRRHELDGVLDGIVYAGMVGIGFAFTENILYLAAAYDGTDGLGPGGTEALTGTFILRCLVSPFAHPLFTAFIGIGVGLAVASRRARRCVCWRRLARLRRSPCSRTRCGTPRRSAGTENFFVVYGTLMLPAFLGLVAFALYRRRSEKGMMAAALADAAESRPAPRHRHPVARRPARPAAGPAPRPHAGGAQGERAMREYQAAAIELGLPSSPLPSRHRPARLRRARARSMSLPLNAVRPYISFPGQVVPTR